MGQKNLEFRKQRSPYALVNSLVAMTSAERRNCGPAKYLAHWVRVLASKPDGVSLTPGNCRMEPSPTSCPLTVGSSAMVQVHTGTVRQANEISKM